MLNVMLHDPASKCVAVSLDFEEGLEWIVTLLKILVRKLVYIYW